MPQSESGHFVPTPPQYLFPKRDRVRPDEQEFYRSQGLRHINRAIAQTIEPPASHPRSVEFHWEVADVLTGIGQSPQELLDSLYAQVDKGKRKDHYEFPYRRGIAHIEASQGNYEAVTEQTDQMSMFDRSFAYLNTVEVAAQRGDASEAVVFAHKAKESLKRMRGSNWQEQVQLAAAYSFAGEIEESRTIYENIENEADKDMTPYASTRAYVALGESFVRVGQLEDALRMADKLATIERVKGREPQAYRESNELLRTVAEKYADAGSIDQALQVAEKVDAQFVTRIQAKQVVEEAKQGHEISELKLEVLNALVEPRAVEDYAYIEALLGQAEATVGNLEGAKEHWQHAWQALENDEILNELESAKMEGFLDIAKAVDESGYDASFVYKHIVAIADKASPRTTWDIAENLLNQAWRKTVGEMATRGYVDLARSAIDNPEVPFYMTPKVIATVGAEEIRYATS